MNSLARDYTKTIIYEVLLIAVALVALFPFLWMALSSLKPIAEILQWPITLLPKKATFENYVNVFTAIPLLRYLMNSAIVAIVGTLFVTITGSMAAYSLSIIRLKTASFFLMLALLGLIVPVQLAFIPLFLFANFMHIQNTYVGLIFPFLVSPFGVFLLTQFFRTIPVELVDAARIDGMREGGIIRHIVIPLGRSGITTLVIFQFMMIWREFFWPLLVINDDSMRTVTLGIAAYFYVETNVQWGLILAAATAALMPILIVFAIFQRRFIAGITVGGLKG
ncbi:MAG TPA: carbohydrate ABC transporter permease [Spirochaetia bacterium]|nr:carbohydrate ABC transporter permease [Spirochaetia bacterium]